MEKGMKEHQAVIQSLSQNSGQVLTYLPKNESWCWADSLLKFSRKDYKMMAKSRARQSFFGKYPVSKCSSRSQVIELICNDFLCHCPSKVSLATCKQTSVAVFQSKYIYKTDSGEDLAVGYSLPVPGEQFGLRSQSWIGIPILPYLHLGDLEQWT